MCMFVYVQKNKGASDLGKGREGAHLIKKNKVLVDAFVSAVSVEEGPVAVEVGAQALECVSR